MDPGRQLVVIPGWPKGPGPEAMNTGVPKLVGSCSWIPGSRAAPALGNDGEGIRPREF
jgi:hypothetical protein